MDIKYTFERRRLFSGFDGKFCKVTPAIATDGEDTVLLSFRNLLLTGCDVVYGSYIAKSTDGGKTFTQPVLQENLKDTYNGNIRRNYSGQIHYSKVHKKWYGLGLTHDFADDNTPILVNGALVSATCNPLYLKVDVENSQFTGYKKIPFPYEYTSCVPMSQIIEFDNGDILVPFYYRSAQFPIKAKVVTVRYAFCDDGLEIVDAGEPLACEDYSRGLCEPSLAYLNGKYYMTIRTDEVGLWAVSDDGLHFSKPEPWRWDDGSVLENYNTQQHWVCNKNGLFLTYTRKDALNGHVFRHRAPIFMTRFDEERKCLIRKEEVILVPELGARLGNYNVNIATEKENWLVTAEWMQPIGCEKYGSDNSIWWIKISFEEENV